MKKKLLSVLLSVAMLWVFTGCGKTAPAAETPVSEEAPAAEEASASEETSVSEEVPAAEETQASEESSDTTGGSPWIDSDIKANISADTETNPKDDFHLYANKDWILENEIPAGYSSWSHYTECGLEVKNVIRFLE